MRNLLRLSIFFSTLYLSSFTTASPSASGLGPGFEPNTGDWQDENELQLKYRSLLDENAALRDEVCPMCIQAVPRAGERMSVDDRLQIRSALGEDRYDTFLAVMKELVSWKAEQSSRKDVNQKGRPNNGTFT